MALSARPFRLSAAALVLLGLMGALACGGKKGSSSVASTPTHGIIGTVRYTKVPLHKDANGVPTGMETDTTKFNTAAPARGVLVKVYQRNVTTLADGSTAVGWVLAGQKITDLLGTYQFTLIAGKDYSVEVVSEGFEANGLVSLIAEPNGLSSTLPQAQRARYRIRKSPDGTAATPADVTPYSTLNDDKVLPFTVDATTSWLIGRSDYDPTTRTSVVFPLATFEAAPTGNKPLAILDTINNFSRYFGDPTPTGNLDLHYYQGRSEPEGTFIEYNQARWIQPDGSDLTYDADLDVRHYFGSVSGGANDDALDEAVLYQMAGRGALFQRAATFPMTGSTPQRLSPCPPSLDNLSPELALQEGFPAAMAADLLKSPYLADTNGATLATPNKDIRLSGVAAVDVGPLSPRTLTKLSWDLILKANSLPNPGVSTDWDKIDPIALSRFFAVNSPVTTTTTGTVTTTSLEMPNAFNQVKLLQSAQVFGEPVDLSKIFTDAVLTPLLAPYNMTWPQPTSGANSSFITFWGTDPAGAKGPLTLSMAQAQAVGGTFPNLTQGEVKYAYFNLDADTAYDLSVTTSPAALPSGAQVEVSFLTPSPTQFSLRSAGSAGPTRVPLIGGTATIPSNQMLRIRLLSPTTQIPDVQVSLTFTKALVPKHG